MTECSPQPPDAHVRAWPTRARSGTWR